MTRFSKVFLLVFGTLVFTGEASAQQLFNAEVLGEGYDSSRNRCLKYTADAIMGGKMQKVHGTACQKPDGNWQIIQQRTLTPQPQEARYVPQPQHYQVAHAPAPRAVASSCRDSFHGSTTKTWRSPNYRRLGRLIDQSRRQNHRVSGRIYGEIANSFFPKTTKRSRESTRCSSETYYVSGQPGRANY